MCNCSVHLVLQLSFVNIWYLPFKYSIIFLKNMNKLGKFLLNHPFPVAIYRMTFQSPDIPTWPIVHAFWCVFLELSATKNIYTSFWSKLIVTLIMALTQDRFMVIFQNARNQTFDVKLSGFLSSLAIESALLLIIWIIVSFIPRKYINKFTKYLGLIVSFPTSMEKIRTFYFIYTYMKNQDPRLSMITSIGLAFGPEFIEIFVASLCHNRAPTKYTRMRTLVIECIIFAVVFQLLLRRNQISAIFGFPPQSIVLQYINFLLPMFYVYIFLAK